MKRAVTMLQGLKKYTLGTESLLEAQQRDVNWQRNVYRDQVSPTKSGTWERTIIKWNTIAITSARMETQMRKFP